jgi:hypothetical protein
MSQASSRVCVQSWFSFKKPVQAPPSPNHAPPQLYMLFLLNERTYSSAVWIKLKRSVLEDEDSLEADVEER